jgi:phage gpG-like protein
MIEFDWIFPLARLRVQIRARRDALADFRSLHGAAAARLKDWVQRNFEEAGKLLEDQPSGWPRLSAATRAAKRRRGQSAQPLVATGRLRAGFAAGATGDAAVVSNSAPYARFHQSGEGVPRRALFPQADQAARIVWPDVLRHVEEALA